MVLQRHRAIIGEGGRNMANRSDLYVHMVWTTAGRRPLIPDAVRSRLYALMAQRCRGLSCVALAIGGMPDHVHLLVRQHPATSVAALAKDVKGASSHFMRTTLVPQAYFQWQSGYGAFSLGVSDLPKLQAYIHHQAEHHQCGTLIPTAESPD
jgi:putative transposase